MTWTHHNSWRVTTGQIGGIEETNPRGSPMGQSSGFGDVRATSALPLIADIRWEDRQVRFVPILLQNPVETGREA
jgi:hypothetical protein